MPRKANKIIFIKKLFTSGYQWLALVTNGDENAKNKRKRTKKKNKNIFYGLLVKRDLV